MSPGQESPQKDEDHGQWLVLTDALTLLIAILTAVIAFIAWRGS